MIMLRGTKSSCNERQPHLWQWGRDGRAAHAACCKACATGCGIGSIVPRAVGLLRTALLPCRLVLMCSGGKLKLLAGRPPSHLLSLASLGL